MSVNTRLFQFLGAAGDCAFLPGVAMRAVKAADHNLSEVGNLCEQHGGHPLHIARVPEELLLSAEC